jgi:methylated-DNA-[protein]-cysteine S-methyltransferase
MFYTSYHSPLGEITLTANNDGLTALAFCQGKSPINILPLWQEDDNKFIEVKKQLDQYFSGQRKTFELALAPEGTPFQQKVWQALTQIKSGETKTYAWLAKRIKNEKAVRAVGSANGANPIALIIPCHRVIGSNGKLTGYAGGLALKAKLLMHEGAQFTP